MVDQEQVRDEGLDIMRKAGWHFTNDTAPYYPSMSAGVGIEDIYRQSVSQRLDRIEDSRAPSVLLNFVWDRLRDHNLVSSGRSEVREPPRRAAKPHHLPCPPRSQSRDAGFGMPNGCG